jgi:hypothetical protein
VGDCLKMCMKNVCVEVIWIRCMQPGVGAGAKPKPRPCSKRTNVQIQIICENHSVKKLMYGVLVGRPFPIHFPCV